MKSSARPETARDLLQQLTRIFPGFGEVCSVAELDEEGQVSSLHFVMNDFCTYFGASQPELSKRQLRELGELTTAAVEKNDALENAFATCFLEHLHQVEGYKRFAPYLSALAKQRTRP